MYIIYIPEKLEKDGIKPIEQILEKLNLPPRPPTEGSANFSWVVTAGRGRRMLGLNVLLSVQVAEDVRNTSRNRVVVRFYIIQYGLHLQILNCMLLTKNILRNYNHVGNDEKSRRKVNVPITGS